MSDLFGSPVASGINPNQGMQTLSGILGVKSKQIQLQQQQQDLQTGQFQQQSAQANAQQDQQKNSELTAVGNLTKQAYSSGQYQKSDGTFDNQKFSDDVAKAAPTYGQQIASAATQRAGSIFENQQRLFNLETSKREQIGNAIGAVAADPQVNPTKVTDAIEGLRNQYPNDKDFGRVLTSMSMGINAGAPTEQLRQQLFGIARSVNAPSASLSLPQQGTNAAGQNQLINPVTGARELPKLSGGATNPASPAVAGQTVRQTGTGNADVDTSNIVVAGQKDARTNIDLTKRIDQLADVVSPGALESKVSQGLGALGLQNVNQARTELQKDLGRLRSSASSRAGSDDRAATILSGLPTDTTPTQTIHQAMDVTRGSARQDLALGQLQGKSSAATKGMMNGFQGDYSHAVASASPLMHEYYALPPAEQVGFFQRNFATKQQAQAFRAHAESVKKLSPDVVGQ